MHETNNISSTIIKEKKDGKEVLEKSIYNEIMCPLDEKQLNSNKCFNCKFCQINKGKHSTNRNLISLICLFGLKKGSD